jgi:hypothetical protein
MTFNRPIFLLCVCCIFAANIAGTGCVDDGTSSVFIDYRRTGGIAGFDDRLTIYENMTATVTRRSNIRHFAINSTEKSSLERLFGDAGFSDLAAEYPAPTPGADYFTYVIAYRGHTVRTEDTGVPTKLEPIIQRLNGYLI